MQQILDESWIYYERLKKIMNSGYKNVFFLLLTKIKIKLVSYPQPTF